MPATPVFTPVDLARWPRRETFCYFARVAPTGYSLTVELNVTRLRAALRRRGLRFYPAYLWLVTRALNEQDAFKMAEVDGRLGFWSALTPLYAILHEDNHIFSLLWTVYDEDFDRFYDACMADRARCGGCHGLLGRRELPPPNAYTVSCAPWAPFTHFAVHSYENKPYYFPSVEAGRFREAGDQTLLPLSLTCHHAATDGYHVGRFLARLQADADAFDGFLPTL